MRGGKGGPRLALAAGLAGAALLVGSVVVACGRGEAPDVGADQARALATVSPSVGPAVPVQPGGLPDPAPAVAPARLDIPAIGLSASVRPVGIDPRTGDFAVPPSVDEVGWYRFGPGLEASAGSVVIAGHVDSAEQGQGAFYRLRTLKPGDPITVSGPDGVVRRFQVVGREEWPKTTIPLGRYFARDGALRLTLITCGGPFDASARSYRDNIVVTAAPAG